MIWEIMLIHQSHESQFRQFHRESKYPTESVKVDCGALPQAITYLIET